MTKIIDQLKGEDIYKKYFLDIGFNAKHFEVTDVCKLKKDETGKIDKDPMLFHYDLKA